jgi:hypothetical protein
MAMVLGKLPYNRRGGDTAAAGTCAAPVPAATCAAPVVDVGADRKEAADRRL